MRTDQRHPYVLSISKEQLAQLPVTEYDGNIKLIERPEDVERAVKALRSSDIIGFDTETRPSFKKGQTNLVSLLQLSTRSTCYLFRLNHIGLPQEVRDILEDPGLLKVGLSVHDDFHNLTKICEELKPAGFIELQQYVNQFDIADKSLTKVCGLVFGRRISKGQRLSNWEAEDLSEGQMAYASLDAMICIDLYEYLRDGHFNSEECPYKVYPEE